MSPIEDMMCLLAALLLLGTIGMMLFVTGFFILVGHWYGVAGMGLLWIYVGAVLWSSRRDML